MSTVSSTPAPAPAAATPAFANHFWGKDDAGVAVLIQRMHDAKQTCEEVHSYYKERISLEEDYAKRMSALAKRALGSAESGQLKQVLETVRANTETMAKTHQTTAQQLKQQLDGPLESFSASMRQRRKTVEGTVDKLTKAKQNQNAIVEKARLKFEADCHKINGYSAQQNLLMGKELERNNAKLDKVHMSIDNDKRDYQNQLRVLAETIDRWNKEWKLACDKFQDLEEERLNFLKANLWAYTNVVSTACVSDDEGCEHVRVALEKLEPNREIRTFVDSQGTGQEIQDPPEFINYMGGYSRDSRPTNYRVANFSRDSELNVDRDEDGFEFDDQEDRESGFDHSFDRTQEKSFDNSFDHVKDKSFDKYDQFDMPDRSFDRESDASFSKDPVVPEPIPQVDSDSISQPMAALNFHTDVAPRLGDKLDESTSTVNSGSVYSTTSVSSLEDSPKKRSWASPLFRRRSKKDLNRSWARNEDSQASSPDIASSQHVRSSPSRSALSMGDNMFDLGVSASAHSRSPFDARSRSSSPKKLSRDDPLVTALQRLKESSSSASSVESAPVTSKYGGLDNGHTVRQAKRVPSRSAPVSPVARTAALAVPDPAFTANDMQAASAKYSAQTRELFDLENQPRPRMARPRSQVDMRGYEGHEQARDYHTVRERPSTVYDDPYAVARRANANASGRVSPAPSQSVAAGRVSRGSFGRVSPAPVAQHQHQQQQSRRSVSPSPSQVDGYGRALSPVPGMDTARRRSATPQPTQQQATVTKHSRTKSGLPTVSSDGRRVIQYSRAAYDYRAAIAEEVSFRKGEIMLVLIMQEDGWWYVEVLGQRPRFGLAPSNFLVNM